MVPAFNLMSCPNLAVPAEVMRHVAYVESRDNPFAIGVVNGRLERQPTNFGEAVATARMLEADGYNYSLGLAQVNRANLLRYGLDTYEKVFDGCANLVAGAHILAECYGRSHRDWGKAFSCYYSGDFATGYRDGYVERVVGSFDVGHTGPGPITVYPNPRAHRGPEGTPLGDLTARGNIMGLTAMRSSAPDAAAGAPASTDSLAAVPSAGDPTAGIHARPAVGPSNSDGPPDTPFVPHVSGPDQRPASGALSAVLRKTSLPASLGGSQARTQQGGSDALFVF